MWGRGLQTPANSPVRSRGKDRRDEIVGYVSRYGVGQFVEGTTAKRDRVAVLRQITLAVRADGEMPLEPRRDRRGQSGSQISIQEVGEVQAGHRGTVPPASSRRRRVDSACRARCSLTLIAVGVALSIV